MASFPHKPSGRAGEQGFVLLTALVFMLLISMLTFAAMKNDLTEQQISSNMSDRAYTMQLAESALKDGERYVAQLAGSGSYSTGCRTNVGLCLPAGTGCSIEAWQRAPGGSCAGASGGATVFDAPGQSCIAYRIDAGNGVQNPCYIVEQLQANYGGGGTLYRITARAWGLNGNTRVTLQSVVQAS